MERTWVDHQGRPGTVLLGGVAVAIEEKIMVATLLELPKQALIVAVRPGDFRSVELQPAIAIVQRPADCVDGAGQFILVPIAISEHKMALERLKERDGLGVLDVAAVKDYSDGALSQPLEGCFHCPITAMR